VKRDMKHFSVAGSVIRIIPQPKIWEKDRKLENFFYIILTSSLDVLLLIRFMKNKLCEVFF